MVTPFDEHGELDLDAAVALARWLCEHGSDGLCLPGRPVRPVLSDDERLACAGRRRGGDRPGAGGSGSNDTATRSS